MHMLEHRVVLPQKVHPVVVAVWRADHSVNVVPSRLGALEGDAGLMVELDFAKIVQDHTLDAGGVYASAPYP